MKQKLFGFSAAAMMVALPTVAFSADIVNDCSALLRSLTSSKHGVCASGDSVMLTAWPAASTYSYVWTRDGETLPQYATSSVWVREGGTYEVHVSADGCETTSLSVDISVHDLPFKPIVSQDGPKCPGEEITMVIQFPLPSETYQWMGDEGIVMCAAGDTLRTSAAGTYIARAAKTYSTPTSTLVCFAYSDSMPVPFYAVPPMQRLVNVYGEPNNTCDTLWHTITLRALPMSLRHAAETASYAWYRNGVRIPNEARDSLRIWGADTAAYSVEAMSLRGCTSQISEAISVMIRACDTLPSDDVYPGKIVDESTPEIAEPQPPVVVPCSGIHKPKIAQLTTECAGDTTRIYVAQTQKDVQYRWGGVADGEVLDNLGSGCYLDVTTRGYYFVRASSGSQMCDVMSDTAYVHFWPRPVAPVLQADRDSLCNGDTVSFSVAPAPGEVIFRYEWVRNGSPRIYTAEPRLSVAVESAAAYKVITYSDHLCKASSCSNRIAITTLPLPTVLMPDTIAGLEYCDSIGETRKLWVEPNRSGAPHHYEYTWFRNNEVMRIDSNNYYDGEFIADTAPGNIVNKRVNLYHVEVKHQGCPRPQRSNTVPITVRPRPSIPVIISPDTVCFGEWAEFIAHSTHAQTYNWYKNGNPSPIHTREDANNTYVVNPSAFADAGTYAVHTISRYGCRALRNSDTVRLSVMPVTPLIFASDTVCITDRYWNKALPDGLEWRGNYTYSNAEGCSDSSFFNPSEAGSGVHYVSYTYINQHGCRSQETRGIDVRVRSNPPYIFYATPDDSIATSSAPVTICPANPMGVQLLTSEAYASYQWMKNGNPMAGDTLAQYVARDIGQFALRVVNNDVCHTDTFGNAITVAHFPLSPAPKISADASLLCQGDGITLWVGATAAERDSAAKLDGRYLWMRLADSISGEQVDIGGAQNSTYRAEDVGVYAVRFMDDNGCLSSTSAPVGIGEYELPMPTIVPDSIIHSTYFYGTRFNLHIAHQLDGLSDSITYVWYRNGATTGIVGSTYHIARLTRDDIADYTVTATSASGCTTSSPLYRLPEARSDLIIPNIFTPNGDGINDRFEINGLTQYSSNRITILDKHGRVVYRRSPYANEWDGDGYPTDVYYYLLELTDEQGSTTTHRGFIHLKR